MDRNTETFTHMGAEGVPWTAISRFTDEDHRFVNLGDGTYFHSGHLAIRQSVAAGANVTYIILYNDAVAMTGSQPHDGVLTPQQITQQMYHERVARIVLMSDRPDIYRPTDLAPGTLIRHRDEIDATMCELREVPGTTVIEFEQTCAAEKRCRRKRGTLDDIDLRLRINPAVCEGRGDCSAQSNCIAVEPEETTMGRKRRINQSMRNKDYSCLIGFCPSFVTIRGGSLRKSTGRGGADVTTLPEPAIPALDRTWNLVVAGVGGSGVLTIGALLSMAAYIEGKTPMVLHMAGLAQKGGAVLSHVRLSDPSDPPTAPRITAGSADLLFGADAVVAASKDSMTLCDAGRTDAVLNTAVTPVSDFIRNRDFDFRATAVERSITAQVRNDAHFLDFSALSEALLGDEIGANLMMLGYAWQQGLIPLQRASILQAIELNAISVKANTAAFDWSRKLADDRAPVLALALPEKPRTPDELTTEEVIAHRKTHLTAYQNADLADRYATRLTHLAGTLGPTGASLLRQAAISYACVLAYKDAYEVARLYVDPAFRTTLTQTFDGPIRIALNLALPFLSGKTSDGRPKKREFGPWILPVMRLLTKLKFLRGTWADPFGYSRDRKLGRSLIDLFEQYLDLVEQHFTPDKVAPLHELLSLSWDVRGYGPVKAAAGDRMLKRRAEIRAGLANSDPTRVAAE